MDIRSKIELRVKGKNVNRFVKRLATRKINILSLKYVSKNEVKLIIYKDDYERVLKLKSIYEISEEDVYGVIRIKRSLIRSKHFIIILFVCYMFFIMLTHVIFEVKVVHSNKDIRALLKDELWSYGIRKYAFKKSYDDIQKIKEKILNKYPDRIEWLEIKEEGTRYLVLTSERKITKIKSESTPRNLVAKKDAVIKKVTASKGDIVRFQNDYVKKGDVIVNGDVMLNEKSMGKVRASGKAYGEVWYVIKTKYPFAYFEKKQTSNKKENYAIKFLNKDIEFCFKKYKNKKVTEKTVISHSLLPLRLVYSKQREVVIKNEILTFDEALSKAKSVSLEKMKKRLKDGEYIIRSKYLRSSSSENFVSVWMFYSVYEDITDYSEIGEES